MKTCLSAIALFLSVLCFTSSASSQNGIIEIADAAPIYFDSLFFAPVHPQVLIKFTNSTGVPIHTISTGFKITSLPSVSGLRGAAQVYPYYEASNFRFDDLFNLEAETFGGSNLADVDTVGFFARADSTNPSMGMPIGWSNHALVLDLGYMNSGPAVERVCIDTCSLPPNRPWRWVNTTVTPPDQFTPEFVGLPYQTYQNGEGPDRLGSGFCWSVRGFSYPPVISNCPPGTVIVGTPCTPFVFDFNAQDTEGDPIVGFGIDAGPGQITSTGLWTWPDVSIADTGSYQLEVYAFDIGGRGPSAVLLLTVTASPAVQLTSGCNTDVMLTGDSRQVQMGTSNGECDDNIWSMSQLYGPPTGATCTIDSLGLIQFSAVNPANYEYRVIVTDGVTTDTCSHSFIVHGGPGCCVLQRGNVDGVAGVDLSDLSRMIAYMYNAFTVLPCWDEANINGSGIIDLTDLSILISYLTVPGSVTLANCPGSLGH